MSTKIEYACKFCGQPRVLTCDIPSDCPPVNLEKWKKMLVCDSCADFERARRDTEENIRRQCMALNVVRVSPVKVEKMAEVEQKCRTNLVFLTKRLAELICKRNRRPIQWEPEVVEFIMQNPTDPWPVLNRFMVTLWIGSVR